MSLPLGTSAPIVSSGTGAPKFNYGGGGGPSTLISAVGNDVPHFTAAAATSHAVNKGIEDGYHKAVTKLQKHQERLNIARERTQL